MKRPEERGPIGAWAYRARHEADLTPEQVVERLAAQGYAVKASTIRGIEGGSKRPSARLRHLLAEVYGSTPPSEPQSLGQTDALVGAISALVEELRIARQEQRAWERGIERAVQAALAVREVEPSSETRRPQSPAGVQP